MSYLLELSANLIWDEFVLITTVIVLSPCMSVRSTTGDGAFRWFLTILIILSVLQGKGTNDKVLHHARLSCEIFWTANFQGYFSWRQWYTVSLVLIHNYKIIPKPSVPTCTFLRIMWRLPLFSFQILPRKCRCLVLQI